MAEYRLKIKKLNQDAVIPCYAHEDDSGLDLYSVEDKLILPGETILISTGIAVELPPLTEAQIRPRSGLALKYDIILPNAPGTIDEGYRGEIKVIISNMGRKEFELHKGQKIAQMVIAPVIRPVIDEVEELGETERGADGFGSTGL